MAEAKQAAKPSREREHFQLPGAVLGPRFAASSAIASRASLNACTVSTPSRHVSRDSL